MFCATECRCEFCSHTQHSSQAMGSTNERPTQLCSCRQQHHRKFLEEVSKAILFRGKTEDLIQKYWLRQLLTKARWTLSGTTDNPGGQLSWLLSRSKEIFIIPKFHSDLPKFASPVGGHGLEVASEPWFSVCVGRWGFLYPLLLLYLPVRSPSSKPAFQRLAIEALITMSSVLVCWPQVPCLIHHHHSSAQNNAWTG